MNKAIVVLKWIFKILLGVLVALIFLVGLFSLRLILAAESCSKSNEYRADLTENRIEIDPDYYGADMDKLQYLSGGVYEIPGIDAEDMVCSTVYWFGQPYGEPLKILLSPDSDIKAPVFDLDSKLLLVGDASAPIEYAGLIKTAMKGDRHQGIEWTDEASLRICLGENGSFYFQSTVYLYEAADGRGRVYFVQGEDGLYYEIEDKDGFYLWLDMNVFVSR